MASVAYSVCTTPATVAVVAVAAAAAVPARIPMMTSRRRGLLADAAAEE
jgi:hypothetical protein